MSLGAFGEDWRNARDPVDWRAWLLFTFTNNDDVDRALTDEELKREVCCMCDAAPDLQKAARAAWHLCQSLLAVRDGATDDLIREVSDGLQAAIAKAEGREP